MFILPNAYVYTYVCICYIVCMWSYSLWQNIDNWMKYEWWWWWCTQKKTSEQMTKWLNCQSASPSMENIKCWNKLTSYYISCCIQRFVQSMKLHRLQQQIRRYTGIRALFLSLLISHLPKRLTPFWEKRVVCNQTSGRCYNKTCEYTYRHKCRIHTYVYIFVYKVIIININICIFVI